MCKFWHKHSLILSNLFSQPSFSFWPFISNFYVLFCFLGDFVSLFIFSFFSLLLIFFIFKEILSLYFFLPLPVFYFITTFSCCETTSNLCQNFILKDCSPITRMRETMVFSLAFIERFQKKIFLYSWFKNGLRVKI